MTVPRLRGTPDNNDEIRTGWIVDAVQTADPSLSRPVVLAAVKQVAPGSYGRAVIALELTTAPTLLTSGDPGSKAGTQKLIKALVAAGSRTIRRPGCTICRRVRDLDLRLAGGGPACVQCTRMLRATICPGCHRLRPPYRRQSDGATRCQRCVEQDPASWQPCGQCGRSRPVAGHSQLGPLCQACLPRPRQPCDRCRNLATVHSRLGGEAVCSRCAHQPQRICSDCRYPRLHQVEDAGCSRCGGSQPVRCPACGDDRFAFRVGAHGCFRCRLHRHVDRLTATADPDRVAQLAPFLDGLRHVDDPRRAVDWLAKRKAGRAVIVEMLHGRVPVSHNALDAAEGDLRGQSLSVEYVRQLLIDASVLPPRDEALSRLERTINLRLATTPNDAVPVLRQYATWKVIAEARKRIDTGRPSGSAARCALASFTAAHDFLTWLDRQGMRPAELTQTAVDEWVAANLHRTDRLAVFLTWAARRGLLPPMRLESSQPGLPSTFAPAADQIAAVRRCLTDTGLSPQDRLAGCLLLLYGQPLSRIVALQVSDLDVTGTVVTVQLGRTPLALPEPLAQLARDLTRPEQRLAPGITRAFITESPWLFPGRPATKPIAAGTLRTRLITRLDIPGARMNRNTARLTLARDVPPIVLADLLGLDVGTVERWRQLAGGRWANYTGWRSRPCAQPSPGTDDR